MAKAGELPALLKSTQAAAVLNCNRRKVIDMCARGEIKAVKVGTDWRINRDALLAFAGLDAETEVINEVA